MAYFHTKNAKLGYNLREGLRMELFLYFMVICYFYYSLVYFIAIWYSFGIFFPFWFDVARKIWQSC
jgi:hypothetical protein